MRLANALCRFVELAAEPSPPLPSAAERHQPPEPLTLGLA
jgi:hypothetical protein